MVLHKHIAASEIVQDAKAAPVNGHHSPHHRGENRNRNIHSLAYGSRYATGDIPKYELPKESTDASVAYQLIHDELQLDGRPALNLASFVGTWMEPEAEKLIMESLATNLSDVEEYPGTIRIQSRCVSIIGDLWKSKNAIGTSTVGSSEAIQMAGLAMKKRWQGKRREAGLDASKPNIVMGSNAQVALEKFARYFDVEERLVPISEKSRHCLDIEKAIEYCDENTIGVFVILGSTYTGHFENVEGMAKLLDKLQEEKGWDIPIHVDAASGGFVAPFAFPDLRWSFEIDRVKSINTSGHKFGLVYAGIGWILWRDESFLPKELIFELHYLGGTEQTYTLNFSRPACFMIAAYYNLVRLGHFGFRSIMENCLVNATLLSRCLERSDYFDVISDMHRPKGVYGAEYKNGAEGKAQNPSLPVVAFKLTDEFKKENPHVKQVAVSTLLRIKGWIVPNYPLAKGEENVEILRVVVRESLSEDLVEALVADIIEAVEILQENSSFDVSVLSTKGPSSSGQEGEKGHKKTNNRNTENNRSHGKLTGALSHPTKTFGRTC
ncbi:hypothetical protein BGZ83_006298 [Gryganskiella cystojenkinii]|nr:hypothetical protein BGZ83_006298 [Gryganskiella cystojenkinii]